MTHRTKKLLYTGVGIVISGYLVWLLLERINFAELSRALSGANYYWLLPNVAFIVLTMYQRAWRWRAMVEPIAEVPFRRLLAATWIGFMANNVLPLRLGEFVRAYSLAAQERRITKSASLATIFVERMVFDLVALLLIFGAVLYYSHILMDSTMQRGLWVAIAIALGGILFITILASRPAQVGRLLTRYLFFVPAGVRETIRGIILKFSRGLEFLSRGRSVVSVSAQTLLIWILMGLSNIFVFWAFGLDLPLDASYVVLVVVSISILVPSTPGFVGVYHFGAVWSLMQYGVTKEAALSCALVLHAAQYIVVTIGGFYFLRKEHLSLGRLEAEAAEPEGQSPVGRRAT
ncbi:MAG TPA: lysylphosphatidylglycerol synthase transmembrane domain-containing protein [candidate division Zixibacteria bacterium]|nr:flippase-like domain-containing protein [candidate division Zixibacteria bacterium]MDD4918595.1 lysylphosphatidylglycerol synthase transmembrane domain-containing protein [candidate division Zixibacteria bacterium]MDM7974322.1 lysylphosphatidylglycerol synthase transmembrane domain-containing protein [candidate division Zixibacteria bacterium]HOZ07688.1 lysylphosphatidylglycerol synthase transmembrane domain-containing protein [candidate division Zixibacteria bacterium]HPM37062.1 lysylphosph